MPNIHEPSDQFIERLAGQISAEVRRRNQAQGPRWTWWLLQSPLKTAVAVATLIIVSMGIGAFAVVAAYQAQSNEQRSVLIASYEQRAELARQRVAIAREQLKTAEQRVAVGLEGEEAVLEGRFKVSQAEAQLKSVELQIAEVRISGREPLNAVSAPLVGSRDFVTERWRVEMSVSQSALELEAARLKSAQRRVDVGVGNPIDVEASRTRTIELQAAIMGFDKRIGIRQKFLKRELDAPLADLHMLEAEAEQRQQTLLPRLDLARRASKDLASRVQSGTAPQVDLLEAQLRLQELQLEAVKTDVELAMIRRQILQKRAGR